jgi:hypothetical protein
MQTLYTREPFLLSQTPGVINGNGNLLLRPRVTLGRLDRGVAGQELDLLEIAAGQVLARVLEQGSLLSAVRLAEVHAACDVLGIRCGFDENDRYGNLGWLNENQQLIERRLFAVRHGERKPQLFLYDVTSSYLKASRTLTRAYGYDRDGKKGKRQIVIGLLCDGRGEPVSSQVFCGNIETSLTYERNLAGIAEEAAVDGTYVLRTSVAPKLLSAEETKR